MNPLIRTIPPGLVRFFARPYVAGDSLNTALDRAADLLEQGRLTTMDLLAENVRSDEAVTRNTQTYLEMADAIAADPRLVASSPTLSLKPSSYTTRPIDEGGDAQGSAEAVYQICERAQAHGLQVTVDMESRHWTDFTLGLVQNLYRDGFPVGAVLQTRLHRTSNDLDSLPEGCRVRLVIGIYAEPKDAAITDKATMKNRLLEYGEALLRRGHYVEFGTHDETYIRRFIDDVAPSCGAGPDRYEIQMLYGVPRGDLQQALLDRGIKVRIYMPFALSWSMAIAYLRRRLDEYPAMMWLVAKNFWSRSTIRPS